MVEFVVFGKKECTFCAKVQDLLVDSEKDFSYYDIDKDPILADVLLDMGLYTVPQVFTRERRVGGYEDTVQFLEVMHGRV